MSKALREVREKVCGRMGDKPLRQSEKQVQKPWGRRSMVHIFQSRWRGVKEGDKVREVMDEVRLSHIGPCQSFSIFF